MTKKLTNKLLRGKISLNIFCEVNLMDADPSNGTINWRNVYPTGTTAVSVG